jgi:selenocysteine lyase/cysteine desulfurase
MPYKPVADGLHPKAPTFQPPDGLTEPPAFGHALRSLWQLSDDWRGMNNGAFGYCPRVVQEAFVGESPGSGRIRAQLEAEWNRIAEESPDLFFRYTYQAQQNHVRKRLAEELLHVDVDDVVFVLNATTGINCVLRSLYWEPGDVIISYNTAYNACAATLNAVLDANPGLELEIIQLDYPLSDSAVLQKTEDCIRALQAAGKTPRLLLLDALSSWPGVLVPWTQLVQICKKHQILSLVDGAHAIGQIPLNLSESKPDFFVTNCHKWLFAHRSSSVMYVDKAVQHLVQAVPTNTSYLRKGAEFKPFDSYSTPSAFVTAFEWTGTIDLSNFFSTDVAIDFRKWLGGEAKM